MPRLLISLIAFGLCTTNLYAQQTKAYPPAIKRILDKAVVEVRKNRQEFDVANQKPLGDARMELQELATGLIGEGKTAEATTVLKQIETLEEDVVTMANVPSPVAGRRVAAPQKPLLERISGKWVHPNHPTYFTIEPNGMIREIFKSDGRVHGEGRLQATPDGTAEGVRQPDGWRWKITEAGGQKLALEIFDPKAGRWWSVGIVLQRVK